MIRWEDDTDGREPGRVDSRWDPHARSWITVLQAADGGQVGEAMYDGTRADRAASIRTMEARLAEWKERIA
jgi:hypothetical protein